MPECVQNETETMPMQNQLVACIIFQLSVEHRGDWW